MKKLLLYLKSLKFLFRNKKALTVRSIQEWNSLGCRVRKGSKAVSRSDGQNFFDESQVVYVGSPPVMCCSCLEEDDALADAYLCGKDWY